MKRFIASFLSLVLMISFAFPAVAEEIVSSPGKEDVDPQVVYRQTLEEFVDSYVNPRRNTSEWTDTYYYDSGNVKAIHEQHADGSSIYTDYNEAGYITSVSKHPGDGSSIYTYYDETGNITNVYRYSTFKYDPVNQRLYQYETVENYNSAGQMYKTYSELRIYDIMERDLSDSEDTNIIPFYTTEYKKPTTGSTVFFNVSYEDVLNGNYGPVAGEVLSWNINDFAIDMDLEEEMTLTGEQSPTGVPITLAQYYDPERQYFYFYGKDTNGVSVISIFTFGLKEVAFTPIYGSETYNMIGGINAIRHPETRSLFLFNVTYEDVLNGNYGPTLEELQKAQEIQPEPIDEEPMDIYDLYPWLIPSNIVDLETDVGIIAGFDPVIPALAEKYEEAKSPVIVKGTLPDGTVVATDAAEVVTDVDTALSELEETDPETAAELKEFFEEAQQDEDVLSYGVVDFGDRFLDVDDDFILVPIFVKGLLRGQKVRVALSNGDEHILTCEQKEIVWVPFPKNAKNIGYAVFLIG